MTEKKKGLIREHCRRPKRTSFSKFYFPYGNCRNCFTVSAILGRDFRVSFVQNVLLSWQQSAV